MRDTSSRQWWITYGHNVDLMDLMSIDLVSQNILCRDTGDGRRPQRGKMCHPKTVAQKPAWGLHCHASMAWNRIDALKNIGDWWRERTNGNVLQHVHTC